MESILHALDEITGTGRFCSTGSRPFFFPGISVQSEDG